MIDRLTAPIRRIMQRHHKDSRMLVLFLALVAAAFALLKLASEVLEGDTFALDRAILRGLRTAGDAAIPLGPKWLQLAMIDITALGGFTVLTLITVFAVGFLLALRTYATALFVALAVSGGAVLGTVLKAVFVRARPDVVPHLVLVNSASFPSGHAMNSALVYLTLATLLARAQAGRRVRIYLLSVAMVLTLLIGTSRVYLGVHWPSDVVAGWGVGAAWAVVCALIAKALEKRRKLDLPVPPEPETAGDATARQ